ncbi:MAG TPA: right-handed parallel beta-helix repeat-containing protein [Leeuwenhoekiella sp.]|nr:right-handed parallel beta-helix repeat-containing protein [Leeuwenhoekiella sp.]
MDESLISDESTELPQAINSTSAPVTKLPYPEIPEKSYTIELDRWDIPSDRTDADKTTANLQKAIDWAVDEGYGIINLPKGHYLVGRYGNDIYQAGIALKSNMAFMLDKEAIIEMVPNDKWNYCVLEVTAKERVVISGGTILGDRDNHTYTPRPGDGYTSHDEGHLVCIQNESAYVTVENVKLTKANGDGILLVGQKGPGSSVKHITIKNNEIVGNRRQGISIVGGEDVLIENNEIHHTSGTSPQFGIDIESKIYNSSDIRIMSNYFHHNRGGDLVNVDGKRVVVDGNILEQGDDSEYIDGPIVYRKNADMTIRRNDITMRTMSVNNWNGIIMYSSDKPKTNPAMTYIYENTCNNCGFYMYKGADLEVRDNKLLNGHLVFSKMKNLTVANNEVEHPNKCWAYRFKKVTGFASGNTYNGETFDIPLSEKPWDGCWIH